MTLCQYMYFGVGYVINRLFFLPKGCNGMGTEEKKCSDCLVLDGICGITEDDYCDILAKINWCNIKEAIFCVLIDRGVGQIKVEELEQ